MALNDELEQLRAEVQHWKANHANMVARCALLSQREDLPVDRIPAYKELIRLQAENADMADALRRARAVFHTNMLRAFPEKTHEEISTEIDRAFRVLG